MTRKPIRVLGAVAAIVLAGLAVVALSRDDPPPTVTDTNHGNVKFAKGEMQRILNAVEATTADTPRDELVAQGRKLFRDSALFEDGESCQTCHAEGSASAKVGVIVHDKQATGRSPAVPTDFDGPREPPALWGLAQTRPYFWNGDVPTLSAAIARPVNGHVKRFVSGDCSDTDSEECTQAAGEIVAKLVAYVRTLDPPTSAFDQGTMSQAALAGEKLFQGKAGCIECHGGPLFTDGSIHNIGVPQVSFTSPYGTGARMSNDRGAPAPPLPPECEAANPPESCEPDPRQANSAFINTPQLRDVKNTAPYMHNGAFQTLPELVRFYNTQSALAPLNLTGEEIDQIVAYLESL